MAERSTLLTRIENAAGILALREKGIDPMPSFTSEQLVQSILLNAASLLDEYGAEQ